MDALFAGDRLTGEVVGQFYADVSTGFGVVEVQLEGGKGGKGVEKARCSGPLGDLVEGQSVTLVGAWTDHPKFGRTFQATYYEQVTPTTVAGLRSFLLSDRFDDVPLEARERALTAFGKRTGKVIESEPTRLVAEGGLDREDADALHLAWREGQALAELVRLVEPASVPYDVVRAVHSRLGSDAATIVRDDPYVLLQTERGRFAQADALARHLGIGPLDPRRLAAANRAALAAARRNDGHQYLTRVQCAQAAARMLKLDAGATDPGIDVAIAQGSLAREVVATDDGPVEAISTPAGLEAERRLAHHLRRLLEAKRPRLTPFVGGLDVSEELTAGQKDAVHQVFEHAVSVLTGGPGTGKTRTVEEVVLAAEAAGMQIALCAPTGRAAKRMEELVGRPATTIHRLLEARPTGDGGFVFRHGEDDQFPYDLVVCDEVSMCDTWLASRLIAAIETGAHLLLVGDPDQLPSVGPGDVLRDLVRAASVPTIELTEVHRQAAGSRIVALAREINAGVLGELKGRDGDVFLAEAARAWIVPRVVEAVTNRAPEYFGVTANQIQIVAPVYRGEAGVDAINAAMKLAVNPGEGRKDLAGFHEGDRVMQTRNDAELEVSNGDIGSVVDINTRRRELRVAFPRGEVTYDAAAARDLTLAWAVTVHKSQGGEWPVVVVVVDSSHRAMLWRNLVYTAVTRAQRALIVVGQSSALRSAAAQDRPRNRQTLLAARLGTVNPPAVG